MRKFYYVLANNLVSNVTNGYLWFALVFWLYLATQSVLVTGLLGGAYVLLASFASLVFGTFVDRHYKKISHVAGKYRGDNGVYLRRRGVLVGAARPGG